MLQPVDENENKTTQSEELLNVSTAPMYELKLSKRIALFLVGCFGLFVISLLITLIFRFLPKEQANAVINFVTYGALFLSLFGIIVLDLPKKVSELKDYKKYLIGLAFGVGVIVFEILYSNFINLFYQSSVNQNETGIRSITSLYPISSLLMFGIVGPICEELTYRVGLFGAIRKFNKVIAYIATIIVFGFMHFGFTASNMIDELVNLPVYLVSGAALCFAYDRFGLITSTSAHISNNLFALIVNILVTRLAA